MQPTIVFVLVVIAFMVVGSATTTTYARHSSHSSSSNIQIGNIDTSSSSSSPSGGLTQIASNNTDFPNNDVKTLQVHVTSAKKDSVGYWHVVGEVTNVGNSSISSVQITAHFYSGGQLIGDALGYTSPINLDPGHTGTFDALQSADQINGSPDSFRLSFDWS
jgi:hypothetical protein